jgi:anti-anti-sigma factor
VLTHLHVVVTWRGADALVRLRGDLDLSTAEVLQAEIAPVVGLATRVVVDASDLAFLDLAGVDALLAARAALAARGGELALAAPSSPAARLLGLLGDPLPRVD